MNDPKQALSDLHIKLADHLADIERLHQTDADAGEHCIRYFNAAIDDWLRAFRYVQQEARQEASREQ